jgi:ribonuclease HII
LLALRDELAGRGVRGIAGVDEVGVGPLAGPVVAGAVVLPARVELYGIDDSKRVRPALRRTLARDIREIAIGVGIGEVSVEEIDQIGIYQAALEAMRRAVASLARTTEVGHLLVDARTVPGVTLPQTSIVKGDQKDASIAAASIVAKVHRDTHMESLARRYPAYGFERHMGYGTALHMEALERYGPCPVHRRSFAPVENAERRAMKHLPTYG